MQALKDIHLLCNAYWLDTDIELLIMNQEKFRVLFIYPNFPLSNMLLPAGVSTLSAVLKENGIETKLFDTTLYVDGKETFDDFRVSINQLKRSTLETFAPAKNINAMNDFKQLLQEFKPNFRNVKEYLQA